MLHILTRHILDNEHWLMERILSYAKERGYTPYTSTLVEAWRASVQGLSEAIAAAVNAGVERPEFSPERPDKDDPITAFGALEARRHRQRGVSLHMFLGLFKYYRQTYVDLVRAMDADARRLRLYEDYVVRCFDSIEMAFCTQWAEVDADAGMAELQDANRRMTNEKNKYLTLFESLANPVFLLGSDGRLDNANLPAAALLGLGEVPGEAYYAGENARGASLRRRRIGDLLPWLGPVAERFLAGNLSEHHFEAATGPDASGRVYEISMARMRDVSEKFTGAVLVLYDITECRRAEQALARLNRALEDKVAARTSELAAANERLMEMDRMKSAFLSSVSHEMRTPLTSIVGFAKLAGKEVDRSRRGDPRPVSLDRVADNLGVIAQEGARLSRLVESVLDLTRIADGRMEWHDRDVDLAALAREAVAEAGRRLPDHPGLELDLEAEAVSLPVHVDPKRMRQVLDNLLDNALRFTGRGRVTVRTGTADGLARLMVVDTGQAIDERDQKRIFDYFFQAGPDRVLSDKPQGTGLGLPLCRVIVSHYGGRIWVESEPGKGNAFIVELPLRL